ncbi:MAG TPA: hypothetical protein VFF28_05625 [Candidatus Nanoarchaeia archaeon]|nr:hypothetical protein [Candidatus Nanoarchaeia archaeon]
MAIQREDRDIWNAYCEEDKVHYLAIDDLFKQAPKYKDSPRTFLTELLQLVQGRSQMIYGKLQEMFTTPGDAADKFWFYDRFMNVEETMQRRLNINLECAKDQIQGLAKYVSQISYFSTSEEVVGNILSQNKIRFDQSKQ